MARYVHRQTSYRATLLIVSIAAVVGIAFLLAGGDPIPPLIMMGVLAAIAALFSTLIIEVADSEIAVGFWLGANLRYIQRADIVRAERSRYGYWDAMKYGRNNVYMLLWGPGIALTLKSGRTVFIGTDDPDGLLAALKH